MKKLLAIALIFSMVVTMTACGSKSEPVSSGKIPKEDVNAQDILDLVEDIKDLEEAVKAPAPKNDPTPTPIKTSAKHETFIILADGEVSTETIEVNRKKPEDVAFGFLKALATNNFSSVLNTLNISGSPFVSAKDIEYSLPRSGFATIKDYEGESVYLELNGEANRVADEASVKVSLRDLEGNKLEEYSVYLILDAENKWFVDETDFYITDNYISTPGKVQVYVDDIELTREYAIGKAGYGDLGVMYKIPVMGKSKKSVSLVCGEINHESNLTMSATSKEKPYDISVHLCDEDLEGALAAVATLWNTIYETSVSTKSADNLTKFFSNSVDFADIQKIYDKVLKMGTSHRDNAHKDFRMTKVCKRDGADCWYITGNIIGLNITYDMEWWDNVFNKAKYATVNSHILLEKDGGSYKIYEVSDPAIFDRP